jgi:nicotinate-nucleotide--dimethylbenzimidazole phosphoribosyltransferase
MTKSFHIESPCTAIQAAIDHKINHKTKPLGALGRLEKIAAQICLIQQTTSPVLQSPTLVIFAADHGIAQEGVSPYSQDVTHQMVRNYLQGGAAVNVFARQNGLDLLVVDAGVNHDFGQITGLINAKIGFGTRSYLHEPAMSINQCSKAIEQGAEIVASLAHKGSNVVGFGEMGIGNTSSSAIIMSLLTDFPLEQCTGRGAGLDDEGLERKRKLLAEGMRRHHSARTPLEFLTTFGGFEIAMMVGAYLEAAAHRMVILVDGFIASAAFLVASELHPAITSYAIFSHQSDEQGHQRLLQHLGAEPLLKLDMRLGEGTGVALAYPLVQAAVNFMNEMASFESAGVSQIQEH